MKKFLFVALAAFCITTIQAHPTAQDMTVLGASNGALTPVSSSLSAYATGAQPLFFNLVSQTNGATILNPHDGSFTFYPTSLPASFNYNVTANDGISNTANVTIIPGPMISTTTDFETDIG